MEKKARVSDEGIRVVRDGTLPVEDVSVAREQETLGGGSDEKVPTALAKGRNQLAEQGKAGKEGEEGAQEVKENEEVEEREGAPHRPSRGLDPNCVDPPYLLGRLFAVLERTSEDALGRRSSGVGYLPASAAPAMGFVRLFADFHVQVTMLEDGLRREREELVGEIMADLPSFPEELSMAGRGAFVIGYYHQRGVLRGG